MNYGRKKNYSRSSSLKAAVLGGSCSRWRRDFPFFFCSACANAGKTRWGKSSPSGDYSARLCEAQQGGEQLNWQEVPRVSAVRRVLAADWNSFVQRRRRERGLALQSIPRWSAVIAGKLRLPKRVGVTESVEVVLRSFIQVRVRDDWREGAFKSSVWQREKNKKSAASAQLQMLLFVVTRFIFVWFDVHFCVFFYGGPNRGLNFLFYFFKCINQLLWNSHIKPIYASFLYSTFIL